jgi:hypothetical protein
MFSAPCPLILPQELVDHILSFLSSSRESLRNCTLVHRTWIPTSRLHLFRIIQVAEPRFHELLSFARGTSFGPQYIRDLTLNGQLLQQRHGDSPNGGRIPVTPAYLRELLAYLPRLDSLFLFMVLLTDEASQDECSPPSLCIAPAVSSSATLRTATLQSLKMYYCGEGSDTFIQFALPLTLFSHIGHLYLRSQKFATGRGSETLGVEEMEAISALARIFPTVGSLKIIDDAFRTEILLRIVGMTLAARKHSSSNAGALLKAEDGGSSVRIDGLHTLEVDSKHHWDHSVLGSLLEQAGPQLKTLSLQLSGLREPPGTYLALYFVISQHIYLCIDPREFCASLHLSALASLKTLTLHAAPNSLSTRPLSFATLVLLLFSILSSTAASPFPCPGQSIETLYLQVPMSALLGHFAHPWNDLDILLSSFDCLHRLVFLYERRDLQPQLIMEAVRGMFPRSERRMIEKGGGIEFSVII